MQLLEYVRLPCRLFSIPQFLAGPQLFKAYFLSIRLAVSLVCVGSGLILGGQWLGFIPDQRLLEANARAQRCETLSIAAAAMIGGNQWSQLQAVVSTAARRDAQLLSIGVRSMTGQLRADSGRHKELSRRALNDDSMMRVLVPITMNNKLWGHVEFCYAAPSGGTIRSLVESPTLRLVGFFFITGIFAYTFLVGRIMGVFNSFQVVPDRVRQALDTLAEGLIVLDESEKIILANGAFCKTIGIPAEELVGRAAGSLSWIGKDVGGVIDFPWTRAIADSSMQTDQMLRYRLDATRECIFSINSAPIQASDGKHRGALVTVRDVTHVEEHRAELETMLAMLRSSRDEISQKNRELEILATQDALTGCLNRRAFFDRFAIAFRFSKQTSFPLSCVMIDNDHFKSVNDTYGHHIGDQVLREVARVLHELHQERHLVCRYGGEEFCVLLAGLNLEEAAEAAENIRQAIMAIRLDDPVDLRLTVSLGVSELSFGACDPQEMINQADLCLYMAKRKGRNQVVCYDQSFAGIEIDETKVSRTKPGSSDADTDLSIPIAAVTALVSALSYRDAATASHSRRVADICVRMAEGLLDRCKINILEAAALLHDIGKIGVPDNVLLKPGPLTTDEWKLMGRHDRIGVEIIASAFECSELSEAVRTHHAFFGGQSRDQSLPSGRDIPLMARILTIADSYDAIVTDRVYRKGRSHDEAVEELRRSAPKQFDPELVERFTSLFTNNRPSGGEDSASVAKSMAMQIGKQIERLVQAIDTQDTTALQALASRLSEVARYYRVDEIAVVAEHIESTASAENVQWLDVLRDTQRLLDLCRQTQNSSLCHNS